ncbi:MAG TPA: hypothetical protein VKI00_26785 [Mycobacterium sp.]|uniref:hypothetical protein n=1 Tax=Mycobacterium sp. TaxID=1785 RepID=UPI002C0F1B23|nr:hypothetical protein [Mycobacterium sp.]HME79129.1 hypothetical protein [Mycobacterium sp.]
MNTRDIARLGMLAVGLGIGAVWAHTPVASADSSTDWLSSIDSLLSGALPAADSTSTLDYQISIDGKDLFPTTGNLATATSGTNDIAIAYGDGANASATGGTGDYALASGTNALANAGGLSTDTGANGDTAIDIGNNDIPSTGGAPLDGAYAGDSALIGSSNGDTGSYDTAIDLGNNTNDTALGVGGYDGAFAGGGGLVGLTGNGNYDTAISLGNEEGADNGPAAVAGNFDTATVSGNEVGQSVGAFAGLGNGDLASVVGGTSAADAGGNFGTGVTGNYDIATVFDPFGTVGSYADSGANASDPGNYDFAGAFADDLQAIATGANYLFEVLPTLF